MKRNLILTFTLLILLFILFTFCAKYKNNPVGSDFFQRDNIGSEIGSIRYPAANDTFYQATVKLGLSPHLSLGSFDKVQSLIMLQFTAFPDSFEVDSAIFHLFVYKQTGDTVESTVESYTASIYKITKEWDEAELTNLTFDDSYIGEQIGTVTISAVDDTISFNLPNDLVQSWIDTTVTDDNFGILLKSDDAEFITEFTSIQAPQDGPIPPVLELFNFSDTTYTKDLILSSNDTFIPTTLQTEDPDYLHIANGTSLRSLIYWDLSDIPDNATINYAEITLFMDTTLAYPAWKDNFLINTFSATDISWPIPDVPYDSTTNFMAVGVTTGDSAVINISNIVQGWVSGEQFNNGLVFTGVNENKDLEMRAFYSTTSDSLKNPKLKLFYSLPPFNSN